MTHVVHGAQGKVISVITFFFVCKMLKAYLPGLSVDSTSDEASEKVVISLNCPWSTNFEEAIAKQS